ncbi:MAG: hypothetical protein IRZ07_03885 [Microbispora sp.]|nr:hypothetical protein [Microbispora sp.]
MTTSHEMRAAPQQRAVAAIETPAGRFLPTAAAFPAGTTHGAAANSPPGATQPLPAGFSREGQPWTDEEVERVREMRREGWTIATVAGAMGRSVCSIKALLAQLAHNRRRVARGRAIPPYRQKIETIRDLAGAGLTDAAIASQVGISADMVRYARKKAGIPAGAPRAGWASRAKIMAEDARQMVPCLGPICRGARNFLSDDPKRHRICPNCQDEIARLG